MKNKQKSKENDTVSLLFKLLLERLVPSCWPYVSVALHA